MQYSAIDGHHNVPYNNAMRAIPSLPFSVFTALVIAISFASAEEDKGTSSLMFVKIKEDKQPVSYTPGVFYYRNSKDDPTIIPTVGVDVATERYVNNLSENIKLKKDMVEQKTAGIWRYKRELNARIAKGDARTPQKQQLKDSLPF